MHAPVSGSLPGVGTVVVVRGRISLGWDAYTVHSTVYIQAHRRIRDELPLNYFASDQMKYKEGSTRVCSEQ